jgi:hypothetical protein
VQTSSTYLAPGSPNTLLIPGSADNLRANTVAGDLVLNDEAMLALDTVAAA